MHFTYIRVTYTSLSVLERGQIEKGRWGWLLGFSVRARSPCRKHVSPECSYNLQVCAIYRKRSAIKNHYI